jgi:hypothetical protein
VYVVGVKGALLLLTGSAVLPARQLVYTGIELGAARYCLQVAVLMGTVVMLIISCLLLLGRMFNIALLLLLLLLHVTVCR